MNQKALLLLSSVAFALSGLSIVLVDLPVAEWLRSSGIEDYWMFSLGTQLLDRVFGMAFHPAVAGSVLLVSGSLMLLVKMPNQLAAITIFVALTNLFSIAFVQIAKLAFGRLRPYELLADATSVTSIWFSGGESFPSGHAGFYWGLFLPLIVLFPRYKWPLLVIPVFISLARIVGNHHYVSDVLTSLGLVLLITLILSAVMRRWLPVNTN